MRNGNRSWYTTPTKRESGITYRTVSRVLRHGYQTSLPYEENEPPSNRAKKQNKNNIPIKKNVSVHYSRRCTILIIYSSKYVDIDGQTSRLAAVVHLPHVIAQFGNLVKRLLAAGTLEAYPVVYALLVALHGERLREEFAADVALTPREQAPISPASRRWCSPSEVVQTTCPRLEDKRFTNVLSSQRRPMRHELYI